MSTFTGPSCAKPLKNSSLVDLYITGRDEKNRSLIGKVRLDLKEPLRILEISNTPVFSLGELGAFDENGVSYPCLVEHAQKLYMYYVGWMPTVLTPFQNHLGLAVQNDDGTFRRVSRAPILERTNDEPFSTGSACVLLENGLWRMWYTSFLRWGTTAQEHKHYYVIKYAESQDGVTWKRENKVCIGIESPKEFAISRPSVVKIGDRYHMWYCTRGEHYRIGYAWSHDGITWKREDENAGISHSESGLASSEWDGKAQAYPNVFSCQNELYMLYNGNDYGREGLGLARLEQP